ncbi:MAG: SDR family oxidoreductase [Pseudomonadota bacterium]
MRFKDQVVVVTGAGSGIGESAAQLFAAEGAVVAVNDWRPDAAEAAAAAIRASGGQAFALPGDVSDPDSVQANVQQVMTRHGRIDVLVNNAGMIDYQPAEEVSAAAWRKIMAVNADGVFFWAQAVARASMLPRRAGAIVNVASPAGLAAIPNNVGYVASKHAVVGITKSLAVEWGRFGIRVNCLCPGITETPMVQEVAARNPVMWADRRARIPLGRPAAVHEQAEAIAFMASAQAGYVHGLIMNVDGGMMSLFSGYSLTAQTTQTQTSAAVGAA